MKMGTCLGLAPGLYFEATRTIAGAQSSARVRCWAWLGHTADAHTLLARLFRYNNPVHIELYNAAQEQQKITEKRLRDLLGRARTGPIEPAPGTSGAKPAAAAVPAARLASVSRHISGTSGRKGVGTGGGITSHVLDTCQGRPASGLTIRLEFGGPGGYASVASAVTNEQGRVMLVANGRQIASGRYRVCFDLAGYYARCREESPEFFAAPSPFFPEASVVFDVSEEQTARGDHFHVPLTWGGPFGYSTYRGS